MKKDISDISEAFSVFKDGAVVYNRGSFLRQNKTQTAGMKLANKALKFIDGREPFRDVLIPLLDDESDAVRIMAASALIHSRPDLALPVVNQIHQTCVDQPFESAVTILVGLSFFGRPAMTICAPDPRYPPPPKADNETIPPAAGEP